MMSHLFSSIFKAFHAGGSCLVCSVWEDGGFGDGSLYRRSVVQRVTWRAY